MHAVKCSHRCAPTECVGLCGRTVVNLIGGEMVKRNVNRATAVGIGAGGTGALLITWGASVIEAKTAGALPAPVAAAALGTVFGFVARWAAKLNPHG